MVKSLWHSYRVKTAILKPEFGAYLTDRSKGGGGNQIFHQTTALGTIKAVPWSVWKSSFTARPCLTSGWKWRLAKKAETTLVILERVELKPSATVTYPVRQQRRHCGTKTYTYAAPAAAGTEPTCKNTHCCTANVHIWELEVRFNREQDLTHGEILGEL